MNRKVLISVIAGMIFALPSIQAAPSDSGDVARVNPKSSKMSCRSGEVIVKFKSDSRAFVKSRNNVATTGVNSVDEVFKKLGVSNAESLMPLTGSQTFRRQMRSYSGREVKAPSFDKAYLINISDSIGVDEAVEILSSVPDIEYAEPNYYVYALGEGEENINDPYYSMQYAIKAINLNKLWGEPVISKEGPIIAIIDTGVDIYHPDLKSNIWINSAEKEGANGYDDDRNGYTDDLYGYDFVNQTGVISDYNGHGTHCAGIAAATGYNEIGIIGANPHARVMPLVALQSNGTGDVATIIKAVDYATANGADIISMSLGTYGKSIAFEQALGRAYQKSVIVAAAGNDGVCLNHAHPLNGQMTPMPMYPAAYTFVLGVQASGKNGGLTGFSNYDDNGPVFTQYGDEELFNYELTAPGESIMSTYPNGQYKALNGTSMATPLVAGALSRLLQAKEYSNREELFGDLINTSNNGILDIYAAYRISDADRKPTLQFVGNRMVDADSDGRADAGEILEFYPSIRNGWGNAEDITLSLDCAENANTFCEFLDTEADFGSSLSSYGKGESMNPLRIRLNDNVVDGRICRLKLTASCPNAETIEQEFEIKVENGVEIGGVVGEDMTLKAGVHYIVNSMLAVPEGVTLTIEPGAVIKFKDNTGLSISGNLVAIGEPGNMITFTKADLDQGKISKFWMNNSRIPMQYCVIENLIFDADVLRGLNMINCVYRNCTSYNLLGRIYYKFDKANIYNINSSSGVYTEGSCSTINFVNNSISGNYPQSLLSGYNAKNSNSFNNTYNSDYEMSGNMSFSYNPINPNKYKPAEPNYLGTSNPSIARSRVWDIKFPESTSVGEYDLSNMLLRPHPEAHGIVWKVLVDGYDAQDEYDLLPPLGVGRHKFEVYYNRVIDEQEAPMIAMGVRPPYTQTAIATEGSWRTENLMYNIAGNDRGQIDIQDGDCESTEFWESSGCMISTNPGYWEGFDGECIYTYQHIDGEPIKIFQKNRAFQNGKYKLQISAHVNKLAEDNHCQYVYLNDSKVYLDKNALNGAVYEVIGEVKDNKIEVGIEQTENIASKMYIDNVSLTLLEEYSNERIEPVSVYTAYLDITGKMNIDGVNRIYVAGGRDLEMFEIPPEDMRFNVNVQAAGSLSTGFYGEAGLGRVNLTWEDLDLNFEDIMGYNMYRINPDSETAVKINERLIDSGTTNYTDYDVTPGKTYQYYYKVMTTDLRENEPSKIIAVTPLTSTLGDSNGSGSVDVADVLTTVNYASGMDPKPFIYEAADVNTDTQIDILDVVGTINIIMGTPDKSMLMAAEEATISIEDDILYIDTPVELAGVQFDFVTNPSRRIGVLDALKGFETTGSWMSEDVYRFMAYNLSGKTIPQGRHALLSLAGADISDARLSDALGGNVNVVYAGMISGVELTDKDNNVRSHSRPGLYNMMGVKVGERQEDLEHLAPGIYILNGWKVVKK